MTHTEAQVRVLTEQIAELSEEVEDRKADARYWRRLAEGQPIEFRVGPGEVYESEIRGQRIRLIGREVVS